MNEDLVNIEIKISYLEDYINQLNDIVIQQGNKIELLIKNNRNLTDKVSLLEENIKEPADNTPPPHY